MIVRGILRKSGIRSSHNIKLKQKKSPGVQIPPTELRLGDPTYARPKIPPSNFKSVKRCARQKSLCEYSREKT